MGDSKALPMKKLNLLMTTALKRGIDDGGCKNADTAKASNKGRAIVETPSFGQSMANASATSPSSCSVASTVSKPIFSVASTASVPGLLSATLESAANNNQLASPVSADEDNENASGSGERKGSTNAASSTTKTSRTNTPQSAADYRDSSHSLQQIIETRSPVSSVEYHAPSPPPASYGYNLHPRYDAAFRPPSIDNSAFTTIGGAAMGPGATQGVMGAFPHGPPPVPGGAMMTGAGGYHQHQRQRHIPSPHQHHGSNQHHNHSSGGPPQQPQPHSQPSYEEMARDLAFVRDQLKEKDMVVSSLQHRVNFLENQINELKQLPTGKISHIPVDDMIRIMQDYGSEVSNQTLPQRKQNIKKASIVRQFRRWNPEFFQYFAHVNGEWVPKLGREGELRRRAEKRSLLKQQGKNTDGK